MTRVEEIRAIVEGGSPYAPGEIDGVAARCVSVLAGGDLDMEALDELERHAHCPAPAADLDWWDTETTRRLAAYRIHAKLEWLRLPTRVEPPSFPDRLAREAAPVSELPTCRAGRRVLSALGIERVGDLLESELIRRLVGWQLSDAHILILRRLSGRARAYVGGRRMPGGPHPGPLCPGVGQELFDVAAFFDRVGHPRHGGARRGRLDYWWLTSATDEHFGAFLEREPAGRAVLRALSGWLSEPLSAPAPTAGLLWAAVGVEAWLPLALSAISPRAQEVLKLRFGLDGLPACTYAEIGRENGFSVERARVLVMGALRRLRMSEHRRALEFFRAHERDRIWSDLAAGMPFLATASERELLLRLAPARRLLVLAHHRSVGAWLESNAVSRGSLWLLPEDDAPPPARPSKDSARLWAEGLAELLRALEQPD